MFKLKGHIQCSRDRAESFQVGTAKEECIQGNIFFGQGGGGHACGFLFSFSKVMENAITTIKLLRRNPPDVGVTSGQKSCTKIIYIVLQTSVGLF